MDGKVFDFQDGNGPVPAKRHSNGGGWVACTSSVDKSAQVSGNARVSGDARVSGNARVAGDAWVFGDARVSGDAQVSGNARVFGNACVSGDARVFGNARVSGNAWVSGNAQVSGDARVSPISISGLAYPVTITDNHLRAGCQIHTFACWRTMTPEQISAMDGQKATDFYPILIGILDLLCKNREAK